MVQNIVHENGWRGGGGKVVVECGAEVWNGWKRWRGMEFIG